MTLKVFRNVTGCGENIELRDSLTCETLGIGTNKWNEKEDLTNKYDNCEITNINATEYLGLRIYVKTRKLNKKRA